MYFLYTHSYTAFKLFKSLDLLTLMALSAKFLYDRNDHYTYCFIGAFVISSSNAIIKVSFNAVIKHVLLEYFSVAFSY